MFWESEAFNESEGKNKFEIWSVLWEVIKFFFKLVQPWNSISFVRQSPRLEEPQPEPKQIELKEPQLEPNWFELEKLQPGAAFKEAGEDPATVMMK